MRTDLHPDGKYLKVDGSLYEKLVSEPEYFNDLIRKIVVDWRTGDLKAKNVQI